MRYLNSVDPIFFLAYRERYHIGMLFKDPRVRISILIIDQVPVVKAKRYQATDLKDQAPEKSEHNPSTKTRAKAVASPQSVTPHHHCAHTADDVKNDD